MLLVVGLGNPGKKFQKTRHNIGFQVINKFQKRNNFPKFRLSKELSSFISQKKFNDEKIILVKPKTFMNLSGKAVRKLVSSFKFQVSSLWVIHDDIDLPLGKIRISLSRSSAGHKGVESIIKELGSKNFVRFRVGIQPKTGKPKNVENFVLQKFNKDEEKIVKEIIGRTIEAIEMAIKEGTGKAMVKYNI